MVLRHFTSMLKSASVSSGLLAILLTFNQKAIAAGPLALQEVAGTQVGVFSPTFGAVSLIIIGGVPPYSVVVDGGLPIAVPPSGVYTNTELTAGGHHFVIKDSDTPPTSLSLDYELTFATSTPPGVLMKQILFTQASTNCSSDGELVVIPTGGSGTYTFSIDGGTPQSSGQFINVQAGSHSLRLTDAANPSNFTVADVPVAINTVCQYTFALEAIPPSCDGMSDGTIKVINPALFGAPNATFSYILNEGAPQSSPTFTGIPMGEWSINIQADGCPPSPAQFVIFENAVGGCQLNGVKINSTPQPVGCLGTITVTSPVPATIKIKNACTTKKCTSEGAPAATCDGLPECPTVHVTVSTLPSNGGNLAAEPTQLFSIIALGAGLPVVPVVSSLDIKKCVKKKIKLGKNTEFKITVTNVGSAPVGNVTVTDVLPSIFSFIKGKSCDSWTFSTQGQTVTAALAELLPNQSSTFKLIVNAAKTVTNEATAQSDVTQPVTASACARLV